MYQATAKWGRDTHRGVVLVEFRDSNGDPYVVMETDESFLVTIPSEYVRRTA